jgi:hypothetical protein
MAVAAGPPGVERGRGDERECGDGEQVGPVGTVRDRVGHGVRDGDGGEQRGQFDAVPPPVVRSVVPAADAALRASRFGHAITVAKWCCVITNAL